MAVNLNIKRLLLIKESQISQVKEFSNFLCMRRCRSLGSLKSLLSHAPQQSGASTLCVHILNFLGVHRREWLQSDGCQVAGILLLRWVPPGLTNLHWRAAVPDRHDILVHRSATAKSCWVTSVLSDSLSPDGLLPTRLLCPWDFPGKTTGMGCHALLHGIFLTQGSNLHLLQEILHFSRWMPEIAAT